MNYLITAAGEGSRFIQKGIKPPKPLIKILVTNYYFGVLSSFDFSNSKDTLFIVTQKKHKVREKF